MPEAAISKVCTVRQDSHAESVAELVSCFWLSVVSLRCKSSLSECANLISLSSVHLVSRYVVHSYRACLVTLYYLESLHRLDSNHVLIDFEHCCIITIFLPCVTSCNALLTTIVLTCVSVLCYSQASHGAPPIHHLCQRCQRQDRLAEGLEARDRGEET